MRTEALLRDVEPPSEAARPTVQLDCTHGAPRGLPYKVTYFVDELRALPKQAPCNNGSCRNRSCPAWANWTPEEVMEAFK